MSLLLGPFWSPAALLSFRAFSIVFLLMESLLLMSLLFIPPVMWLASSTLCSARSGSPFIRPCRLLMTFCVALSGAEHTDRTSSRAGLLFLLFPVVPGR